MLKPTFRPRFIRKPDRMGLIFCAMVFLAFAPPSWAETQMVKIVTAPGVEIENPSGAGAEVVDLNRSLKSSIEENQRLMEINEKLETEIEQLRAEFSDRESRYEDLRNERDKLKTAVEDVKSANRKYAQDIRSLEQSLANLKDSYSEALEEQERLKTQPMPSVKHEPPAVVEMAPSAAVPEITSREEKTIDILSKIDAFSESNEQLKKDAAKAHYNMGNIYYQKGEYELAAREFYQAVFLMPNDPDSHFNLAFVSGEHLRDFQTALKHYKLYLYLNPDAEDAYLVKAKIVDAELKLRNTITSPLDREPK